MKLNKSNMPYNGSVYELHGNQPYYGLSMAFMFYRLPYITFYDFHISSTEANSGSNIFQVIFEDESNSSRWICPGDTLPRFMYVATPTKDE